MINLKLKHKLLKYKFIYYLLYLKHRFYLNFEKGNETKKIKPNKGYPKIEIIKKLVKKNANYKIFSLKNDLIIIIPN